MKSQDIVLLFKLISLHEQAKLGVGVQSLPDGWEGWEPEEEVPLPEELVVDFAYHYTVRGLSAHLGISKSEVAASLKRSLAVGMLWPARGSGQPRVDQKALLEFCVYGLKYVFPATPGPLARGIPTAHAAPVLLGRLLGAGEIIPVWPWAKGRAKGESITPLYRSVPTAVQRDPHLYASLALVDAIRLGRARETSLARDMLQRHLEES